MAEPSVATCAVDFATSEVDALIAEGSDRPVACLSANASTRAATCFEALRTRHAPTDVRMGPYRCLPQVDRVGRSGDDRVTIQFWCGSYTKYDVEDVTVTDDQHAIVEYRVRVASTLDLSYLAATCRGYAASAPLFARFRFVKGVDGWRRAGVIVPERPRGDTEYLAGAATPRER